MKADGIAVIVSGSGSGESLAGYKYEGMWLGLA